MSSLFANVGVVHLVSKKGPPRRITLTEPCVEYLALGLDCGRIGMFLVGQDSFNPVPLLLCFFEHGADSRRSSPRLALKRV